MPSIIRQVTDDRREGEQERLSKETEELRSRLAEEARKNEENLRRINELEQVRPVNEEVPVRRSSGCPFKEFTSAKPPEFRGKCDPIAAANWISEMETIFTVSRCSEEQKVLYSTIVLKGEALNW